jgi:hypothetical protein
MKVLLLTYTCFTTTAKLAEKLIDRYNAPPTVDERVRKEIQTKVCYVFSTWKEHFSISENFLSYLQVLNHDDGSMTLDEVSFFVHKKLTMAGKTNE